MGNRFWTNTAARACEKSGGNGRALAALTIAFFLVPAILRAGPVLNIAAAERYSKSKGGLVLVVRQDGRPLVESYAGKVSPLTPLPAYSITKSMVALACLASPGLNLGKAVPGRESEGITIRHLLSQTSGISPGYARLYSGSVRDVRRSAATLSREAPAGERFAYGPSHFELLGTLPGMFDPPRSPALSRLLSRLGISPPGWRTDRSGNPFLSAGAMLTPPQFLQLGAFVLGKGRGGGLFPVIPPQKMDEALQGSPANPCYGLGFWLNANSASAARERDVEEAIKAGLSRSDWQSTCLSRSAPRDLVCMAGTGGQRVYVIPSLRTVVVRLGKPGRGFQDPAFLSALFSKAER